MTTTLLAVDDSKTMRKVIEITFAGEGFKTVLADGAAEALAKAQAEQPQVALVDAALEGTNGYDLCRQIKGASPATVVVLLANKAQPYDKARGAAVGADDFADKPFDTQQLIDKVTALARRSQQPQPAVAAPVALAPLAAPVAQTLGAQPRARVQTIAFGGAPLPPGGPGRLASAPPFGAATASAPAPVASGFPAPAASAPAPAPVAVTGNGAHAEFASKLGGLGLSAAQVEGVLALSREVVEKVVWEVVPTLAEALIKEEIQRLTRE